jgi:hypothetical protein
MRGSDVLAAFGTGTSTSIQFSSDHGVTWHEVELLPATFVFAIAVKDNTLYAARVDGLWRRSIATVATRKVTWGSVKSLYRKSSR